MALQGLLPYEDESEKHETGLTAMAGLPTYLDLAFVAGLRESVERHVKVRAEGQGWTDWQMVVSGVLLNLAGGESVEDLRVLEGDEGVRRLVRQVETHKLPRKERRALERRWRKERKRSVPSPSAMFRYPEAFHDPEQEKKRVPGKAFIPQPNTRLKGLRHVNRDLVSFVQSRSPQRVATMDLDATLVETQKQDALYCYKHFKAYQPLNLYWAEQDLVVHSEFRDGNVPAGYDLLRVFEEGLTYLPAGVEEVRLRSDTAAYNHALLRYCDAGKNERFGRIRFSIGCDVTAEFKRAVPEVPESEWKPLYQEKDGVSIKTNREWAEVCYVPNVIGHSKEGPEYRYLAIREAMSQPTLPGLAEQQELPFPTLTLKRQTYKLFGLVTHLDWEGERIVNWMYERCGKSEEAHSVMKSDLAGGKLPSSDFGENAAWWHFVILALNLNSAMKHLVLEKALGKEWGTRRLKALRFHLIHLPGRLVHRSRQWFLRLTRGHPSPGALLKIRRQILQLATVPSG